MKKSFFVLLIVLFVHQVNAQSNPEAESLLESVYTTMRSYENISLNFKFSLVNEIADIRHQTEGKLILKDSLYNIDYMEIKQLFDGDMVYTISDENEEITIVDKTQDEEQISPTNLFDFYKDGYIYLMDIKQNTLDGVVQYVKLIPIDSDSETEYLLLGIVVEKLQIYKLINRGNNGTITTIQVKDFRTNTPISAADFVFDRKNYEELGYYIIED